MAKHGKKYLAAAAKIDQDQAYTPAEALPWSRKRLR